MVSSPSRPPRWYAEVGRFEWLMLAIASAGWFFDVFEGQIFNLTSGQLLADLLHCVRPMPGRLGLWRDRLLAVFLVGGTTGGVLFGTLADRYGRKSMMSVTILCYSVFSGLTYFATSLWQVAVLAVSGGARRRWRMGRRGDAGRGGLSGRPRGPAPRASFRRRAFWEPGWRQLPAWRSGPSGATPT